MLLSLCAETLKPVSEVDKIVCDLEDVTGQLEVKRRGHLTANAAGCTYALVTTKLPPV